MEGAIPAFTSTLSQLVLHKNRLKVFPALHLKDSALTTVILLHDNLLSCDVPRCGDATARTSIAAIGNKFRHPKGEFPRWLSQCERDPLFWISGDEGMRLLRNISGAMSFFVFVMAWKLGSARQLSVMSKWLNGSSAHLWFVQLSYHVISCFVKEALLAAVFLMYLLVWDLYACPETLALASACLRSSIVVRTFVFLCWCQLSYHSQAVEHLTVESKKQRTLKTLRTRLLLWLLWCVLTVVFSTLAIIYQMSRSIPGFLPAGQILPLGLTACIGSIQGVLGHFVMPFLASKVTWEKDAFIAMSNLIMNCLLPIAIIMYLDTGCLGRWVALWKPCRSNRQLFQASLVCNLENQRDCGLGELSEDLQIDIMLVRSSDICDPRFSWSSTSLPRCIHISLLRLQEMLLSKLVTTGVVMPSLTLMRNMLPKESGAVLGNFGVYMAYAIVSSGHLPLMLPMLLLACLIKGLMARVAWAQGCFKEEHLNNVAALEE